MTNKKSPSAVDGSNGRTASRYEKLVERFRISGQTPREFVTRCLQRNMVSGADALELMALLSAKTVTRSFALADLTDEEHFRLGFYETTVEDSENKPIFIMQFDNELVQYSDAIQELLEGFARNLAELISDYENKELPEDNPDNFMDEAMETVLDSLPADTVRH